MSNDILKTIERVKGIPAPFTFVADSTTRALDMLCRTFCTPPTDNVVVVEPAREIYRFVADVNHIEYKTVALDDQLSITAAQILKACNAKTHMVWICSPNAVTGTTMAREEMRRLLAEFKGMVVVDELLVDYERQRPLRLELPQLPNLIVLSEPGLVFASREIISRLHTLDALYSTSKTTLPELADPFERERATSLTNQERVRMMEALRLLPMCQQVFAADAPFFVARINQPANVCRYLQERGISITTLDGRPDYLKINVGTRTENNELVGALRQFSFSSIR